jgi:hypothetical protein
LRRKTSIFTKIRKKKKRRGRARGADEGFEGQKYLKNFHALFKKAKKKKAKKRKDLWGAGSVD